MKMTVSQHLEEFRTRLIRCIIFVLMSAILAFYFSDEILYILKLPSKGLIENFLILKPAESITIYLKTALFSGLIFASPLIFWEIFSFIKPAVGAKDISILKWAAIAFLLFVCGGAFVYWTVLSKAIAFLTFLSKGLTDSAIQITLSSYISFTMALLLCGAGIFQIPLAAFILTKIGLITPKMLISKRKEAYFALIIAAAVITPTTDVFSLALFVVPMIILYEVGVIFSKTVHKKNMFKGEKAYEEQC
ncbi:MAG: twin-arginine translocase subunit TatC [Elusimicrobiota bacterium]|jgi:sec-independent protein translocase protein TatC|nr:twin-arginine translocase subunit TatC [Elusimicrobiota bacterium]